MSAPYFLVPELPAGELYTLDGPEGHHAATVQRLRVGENLVLCDGRGGTAPAVVTAVGRGTLRLAVGAHHVEPPPAPRLRVVQGIAKGDRGELAVQAMTEIGVDEIVPWAASRSVAMWKSDRPHQRWVDTVREAAKQSRRAWVPPVSTARSTASVGGSLAGACALVLDAEAAVRLSTVELPTAGEIVVIVGPEGGISPDELLAFAAAGATAVRLGPSVLRTSTAGAAALAVLAARLGRW